MAHKEGGKVTYNGKTATIKSVQGTAPNQILTIKFDDGTERVITSSELPQDKPGQSGEKLNQEQIKGGQSAGGKVVPPNTAAYEDKGAGAYRKKNDESAEVNDQGQILSGEEPVIDLGPGTGDTGAGLKADGKDVDSNNRRILGTEELITRIEPVTRKVVDRNGRTLQVGTVVSLKARIIKFHGANKVEVLYPPFVGLSPIPVWSEERKRLENVNEEGKPNGSEYGGGVFSYDNGKVVDANGNEAVQPELQKQEKLEVDVKFVERF